MNRKGQQMAADDRRRALVTGGAVRVGRSIGGALAEAGYDVAVQYHGSAGEADAAVREFCREGVRAERFQHDLRDASGIPALVDDVVSFLGGLDLLVCSAATFVREPGAGVTVQAWDDLFSLNARGPYFCARAAVPHMSAGASIVNIIDVAAFEAWPGYVTYSASKAALASLTKSLAVALAPEIRVNGIAPGPVLPPETADDAQKSALRELTLPGLQGSPTDIARAVLYLDGANYVTGQILRVDGGQSLK